MPTLKYIRAALLAAAVAALTLPGGVSFRLAVNSAAPESFSGSLDPQEDTWTFYSVRRDLRRCVSPLCGGYFARRVNLSSTRCANGRYMRECYVAEIDWNGQPEDDSDDILVRGAIIAKRFGRFGNLGELRVSGSWKSIGANQPVGTFYLVRDRGVRCITHPCPTHLEVKLNSSFSRNIAGVNLEAARLEEDGYATIVGVAMASPDGVVVTGRDVVVTGPGGRSFELRATQVYVRNRPDGSPIKPGTGSMKPCIRTGCSSQVCSDHAVVTTCEFRPEYACYQKATCERQADGNCGFTKTAELAECLARK
jgi:hypothetical protein